MTFPATAAVHTARVRLAISDASDRTSVVGGGTHGHHRVVGAAGLLIKVLQDK